MQVIKCDNALFLSFCLLFVFWGVAYGEEVKNDVLPADLAKWAKQEQCESISNFYSDRPGNVNPPFVYGQSSQSIKSAFWCESKASGNRKYFLIVHFNIGKPQPSCSSRIEWINPPGGLSLYYRPGETLKGYMHIGSSKVAIAPGLKMDHEAILSEYDGFEEYFYCYQGTWYIKQLD